MSMLFVATVTDRLEKRLKAVTGGALMFSLDDPGGAGPQTRQKGLVAATLIVAVCIVAFIFGGRKLPEFPQFIPIHITGVFLTDTITAVMLFGQFFRQRLPSYLPLASAYLFTAMLSISFFLAFPGALQTQVGFIGGPQSAIWLWQIWHILFPTLVTASVLTHRGVLGIPIAPAKAGFAIAVACAGAVVLAAASVVLITLGHDLLPILIEPLANPQVTPAFYVATLVAATASALSLGVCLPLARGGSTLHLWLSVAMTAFLGDICLGLVAEARYTVAWYFGSIISLVAASALLVLLLIETNRQHHVLSRTYDHLTKTNVELQSVLVERDKLNAEVRDQNDRLKKTNEELTVAGQIADAALQSERKALAEQRNFLAMVSHEFRTPLAIISASAEILDCTIVGHDAESAEELARIHRASKRLAKLVDGCLADEWLEDASHSRRSGRKDLCVMLRELATELDVALIIETSAPLMVDADDYLLPIVFSNLIDNALKYGRSREGVSVRCRPWGETEMAVEVGDDGPGVDPEDATRLFEKFFRSPTAHHKPGAGLGLYLVKRIVELHGGRIELDLDNGTVFRVILPLVEAAT